MNGLKQDNDQDDYVEEQCFKILITGEPGVGKTSLVQHYTNGVFSNQYKATIGVDFATKTVKWDKNTHVRLHLWDLAGQTRLGEQSRVYFKDTHAAICVCDVNRPETLTHVRNWLDLIQERCRNAEGEQTHPPCVLVVNKIDVSNKTVRSIFDDEQFTSILKQRQDRLYYASKPKINPVKNENVTADLEDADDLSFYQEVSSFLADESKQHKSSPQSDYVDVSSPGSSIVENSNIPEDKTKNIPEDKTKNIPEKKPENEQKEKTKNERLEEYADLVAQQIDYWASEVGFLTGIPVSVKYGIGVDQVFKIVIAKCMESRLEQKQKPHGAPNLIVLSDRTPIQINKKRGWFSCW